MIEENATEVCEIAKTYEEGVLVKETVLCYRPLDVFFSLSLEGVFFIILIVLMFLGIFFGNKNKKI